MDLDVRAFRTVRAALCEPTEPYTRRESSRKGGRLEGRARATALSAQRRSEIAKRASLARWKKRNTDYAPATETHEIG
jgi:hypothetical protein